MKKATGLLSMIMTLCLLLAVTPAYAAPAPEAVPGGTVYSVAGGDGDAAVTVVDYQFDGRGEAESGAVFDGGSRYYYGAVIDGAEYGAVVDSAVCGYFGSSSGTIPLYGPTGAMTGIVWGECRASSISANVGLLLRGDVEQCILVEDGTEVTALAAVIRYEGGVSRVLFNNARVSSDSGVLVEMPDDAAGEFTLTLSNGSYEGDINVPSASAALELVIGRGALLHGNVLLPENAGTAGASAGITVADGGTWAPTTTCRATSLQVEDGALAYARFEDADGVLTIYPSGTALEPGNYAAEPLPEKPLIAELPFDPGPAVEQDAEDAPPEDETEQDSVPGDESAAAANALGLTLSAQIMHGTLPRALAASPLSQGLHVHLAVRSLSRVTFSNPLQTALAKSHSFLPETLDNRARILYNPYCCLAA